MYIIHASEVCILLIWLPVWRGKIKIRYQSSLATSEVIESALFESETNSI